MTKPVNPGSASRAVSHHAVMVRQASKGEFGAAVLTMRKTLEAICKACLGYGDRATVWRDRHEHNLDLNELIGLLDHEIKDNHLKVFLDTIRLAGNTEGHDGLPSSIKEDVLWRTLVEAFNESVRAINERFGTAFPPIPTTHEGLLAASRAGSSAPADEALVSPGASTPSPSPASAAVPPPSAIPKDVPPAVQVDVVEAAPVLRANPSGGHRNRTFVRALILLVVAACGGLFALWWANSTKDGTSAPQAREAPADGITVAQVGSLDRGDDAGPQSSGTTQTVAAGLLGGNGGSVNGAQPTDAAAPTGVASSGQSATSVRSGVLATAPIDPCMQACLTKNCGSDGCGGTCGTCKPGFECTEGRCAGAEEKSLIGVEAAYRDFAEWHYAFNRRDREATLGGIADKVECYFNAKDKEPTKFTTYMTKSFSDTRKRVKIPPVELRLCRRCTPSRVAAVEMMKGTVNPQTSPVKKVTILEKRDSKWIVVAIADRDAHGCLKVPFEDFAAFQAEYSDPWIPPEE